MHCREARELGSDFGAGKHQEIARCRVTPPCIVDSMGGAVVPFQANS
jgi:hypothetical protein